MSTLKNISDQVLWSSEYELISDFYKDKRAKRSQVHYMNHINEGLVVLGALKSTIAAQKAYCLHPLLQDDSSVEDNIHKVIDYTYEYVLFLTMEYRNVANRGLHCYQVADPSKIYLSPIKEVNDMLIANKVQNRKDFLIYHYGTHPKSKELDEYFKNWLTALGVNEDRYKELVDLINRSVM